MNPSHPPPPYLRTKTQRFSHNNLSFSPYLEHRFALASGSNFGLVGNGRVHIIDIDPGSQGGLRLVRYFETRDCVFDVAWNEQHENHIVAGCGNGAIKMFDVTLEGLPIQSWHEHSAEIMSIEWNNLSKDQFITSSWDSTIKIWSSNRATSLLSIQAHKGHLYNATFSPHTPNIIMSCGADGFLKIWDLRSNLSSSSNLSPTLSIPNSGTVRGQPPDEVLYCDWNKYDPSLIASASKDGTIKVFDLRTGSGAGRIVGKHDLAARKVAWDPHSRERMASTGYDMTCRVWNINNPSPSPTYVHSDHTEFVMGLGWSLFDPGLLASAAWDEEVHLYRV
ncbi:hypothetical protein I302_103260 [Kwoniella bestiolae CBS 10118]|uniref:Peroxin-7 n=1 Tax=Kwoniella bestiolae CBS 10118 TaxID=1296100 RepID=A0A1B9G7W4_9TREE|nr:hypothetical protein I302_01959 [Kwoniella bestiolae CBS 10118]OCF27124.1 hypothetical protein I302_01959 [Kwoniella bestiolae CBS 10118]